MQKPSVLRTILKYYHIFKKSIPSISVYTITPYGTDIEPNVPSVDESIKTLKELSKIVGKENVLWRFDPLLKTNKISCEWLVDSFKKMAKELSKYVSRCIFSFITPYSHTLANMPEIIPFTEEEKDWITMRMGVIAISENNLHLQICRLGKEYPGVYVEGCPKIFGLNIKPTLLLVDVLVAFRPTEQENTILVRWDVNIVMLLQIIIWLKEYQKILTLNLFLEK